MMSTAATSAATALPPSPPPPAGAEWVVVGGFPDDTPLALLRLDTASGTLSRVSTSAAGGAAPAFAAWQRPAAAPAGATQQAGASPSWLYVTNHARNRPGTGLTAVRWQAAGGSSDSGATPSLAAAGISGFAPVPDPAHAAVAPSGRWVLTASYDGCSVSIVPVLEGGQLGQATTLEEGAVGKAPHEVVFDPSGRFVYVPCLGSDWVRCFTFDDATGALLGLPGAGSGDNRVHLPPGSGARHLAFHPSLPVAYTANELGNSIVVLGWDAASGALSFPAGGAQQAQRVVSTLPPDTPPGMPIRQAARGGPVQAAAELVLSPDGRFLYASNRGSKGGHNSIAVFAVHPSDGGLTPLAWETGGGAVDFPRHISLAAGGALMLVANQHSDSVAVFRRDAATGLLTLASVCSTAGAVAQPTFAAVVPA